MTEKFDNCEYHWVFQTNAINNTMIWRTTFACKYCIQSITLEEKCALEQTEALNESLKIQEKSSSDQVESQKKSLHIQERSLNIAKWATIITTVSVIVSGITLFLK